MNILGLVPARSGSKRLPNKNMATIQDETLVARALRIASEASVFAQIACSTDSEVIAQHVRELGFKVILRPPEIATDISRDVEWVNHAVDELAWESEAFCILRPTNPFRAPGTIRRAIKQFEEQTPEIDSLRAVQPVSERPEKMWRLFTTSTDIDQDALQRGRGLEPYLARLHKPAVEHRWHELQSSSFEDLYIQNGCIEIAHTRVLPNSVSGDRIAPFFTEALEGFDVNTPADLEMVRILAERPREQLEKMYPELRPQKAPNPYPWPIPLPSPTSESAGIRSSEVFEAEDGNLSIRRKKK